ncbi:hypothetical protein M011DRAFT_449116 [Sporormia fimetaria CBS 119925]|uniref:MARVEL domain-containing protein n=1 Tax=Sporormia fimetaria CBS 119925 TaxID=1340428 RepID=A0A6A6V5A3_9PLEO|nr:hypothetical protein M011DRAFT_449116 [Sporormia fimetaria CBS 119925]
MNITKPTRILLALRTLQLLLSLTVIGLMSYVIHWWTRFWDLMTPHEFSFLLFTSIWSVLSLIPLVLPIFTPFFASLAERKGIRLVLVALEALTMLYWLAGFVALVVFLEDRTCFGRVCMALKSSMAVGGAAWAVWAGMVGWGVWGCVRCWKVGGKGEVVMHQGV